jgi:hypothetical protein
MTGMERGGRRVSVYTVDRLDVADRERPARIEGAEE